MSAPRTGKREPRSSPPDSPPPGVIASAATGIVNFIVGLGGDVDQIFGRARIGPDMAGCPTLKLDLHSYCQLFEVAACQTQCDNFGLWFGHQFKPRDLGLWGYSAVSAPTLGSALGNLVRLFRWHQESSLMNLRRGKNGLMHLEYQIEAPAIVERRQDAELSLGMFLNVFRECLGQQWVPEEVHFEHPRPQDSKDHERAFGAPVYFSLSRNALVFRPDILTTPMPHGDSRLMAMMEMCLEQLAGGRSNCVSIVDRVKTAIRTKLPGGYPPLGDLAEAMRITPAAVQRELARDGLIYKDLVEKTRRELALAYLKQPHLPFSEIALLLGYSELSAFSRAVRRWTGRSPRSWRAQFDRENASRASAS